MPSLSSLAPRAIFFALGSRVMTIVFILLGIWVLSWAGLVIHELGHTCAAYFARVKVVEVRLGSGLGPWRLQCRSTPIIFGVLPSFGLVTAIVECEKNLRWRLIAFAAGGPLASAAFGATLIGVLVAKPSFAEHLRLWLWLSLYQTGCMLIGSLWPRQFHMYGQHVETDGLQLLRLLPRNSVDAEVFVADGWLWRAQRSIEAGDVPDAIAHLRRAIPAYAAGYSVHPKRMLAGLLTSANQISEAEQVWLELLPEADESHVDFSGLVDQFATFALTHNLRHRFGEAERLLRIAMSLQTVPATLHATMGAILVETGKSEEGRPLLERILKMRLSSLDTGLCAAYLSKLSREQGDSELASKFQDEARERLGEHPICKRLFGLSG